MPLKTFLQEPSYVIALARVVFLSRCNTLSIHITIKQINITNILNYIIKMVLCASKILLSLDSKRLSLIPQI
jgi:hypothetical protein